MVSIESFEATRLETSRCNEWSPPDRPRTKEMDIDWICKLEINSNFDGPDGQMFLLPQQSDEVLEDGHRNRFEFGNDENQRSLLALLQLNIDMNSNSKVKPPLPDCKNWQIDSIGSRRFCSHRPSRDRTRQIRTQLEEKTIESVYLGQFQLGYFQDILNRGILIRSFQFDHDGIEFRRQLLIKFSEQVTMLGDIRI